MIPPATRTRAIALLDRFAATGAQVVQPPILVPAGPLLDLYGEDIRARAFVTQDPLRGEAMLRPDFTVAIAQAHLDAADGPAAYAYLGEVFRRQEDDPDRPREYLQVGLERLGDADRAAADADVLASIAAALRDADTAPATGDLGLLIAAVDTLDTTPRRRAALRRHIWRPMRFRRLLDRFGTAVVPRPTPATTAPLVGLRGAAEIAARHDALAQDAATPPLPGQQVQALQALLDLSLPMDAAADRLAALTAALPGLLPAVERFDARRRALAARGIDTAALPFAPARGRSAMEYYDGFTFTFARRDGGVVATGGRYDALTTALGGGHGVPAVGGVIRPGMLP
ncbi:ATP phosphoribosyltransferase regulatory subunit [Jannaschia sp. LMIT008]|uniref:ATP phosphoribosyltransferase regulatory subunit n=1 Tax=Jannaschia maritima TaxID=3032585 RepID=UPI0028124A2D|nr:ATP phosphoribosyltransferase regulatory subunit [Jannaschia sp. LMIT008]